MSNRYVVPIGVLIAAILIIVGGYLIISHQEGSPSVKNNESYIEPTTSFVPNIKVQEGELKRNADLQLKIGNKYRYEYKIAFPLNLTMANKGESKEKSETSNKVMKMSGSIDIVVDRKERYNKSDVFVLKYTSTMKIENPEELMSEEEKQEKITDKEIQIMNMFKEGINMSGETWINKDGKTVKAITKMFGMEITTEGEKAESGNMMSINPGMMIQPWMLALNENFEWTKNTSINTDGFKSVSSGRYKVTDIEEIDTKVGKKKCYKVEEESTSSSMMDMPEKSANSRNMKISEKSILWIDYNERILIKAESWMENLKIGEVELVDEKI